jgi:hypothetical protein
MGIFIYKKLRKMKSNIYLKKKKGPEKPKSRRIKLEIKDRK